MSGHNKWTKIKHKKASADQARGKLFSKLGNAISIAARSGADPQFNAVLRVAIDQAKKQNMPLANIERAIKKASEKNAFEPMLLEAYGPEGVGIIVDVITDSTNRSVSELKSLFKDADTKLANQGSLIWSFEKTSDGYKPKFASSVSENTEGIIRGLKEKLLERDDVVGVYTAIDSS